MKFRVLLIVTLAWLVAQLDVTLYQLTTAVRGARELLTLPRSDIEACTAAYEFFQTRQDGTATQVGLPQGSFQRVQVARSHPMCLLYTGRQHGGGDGARPKLLHRPELCAGRGRHREDVVSAAAMASVFFSRAWANSFAGCLSRVASRHRSTRSKGCSRTSCS